MEYRDYYKILGVPKSASQADIKKAYRKLAREHHPDRNAGDKAAEGRFKDVNEAHAVLGDADKRKKYDTLGPNWEAFSQAGAGSAGGNPFGGFGGGNVRYEFRTADAGDLGGFSDFFRTFFSGGGGPATSGAGVRARTRGGATTAGSWDDILAELGMDANGRPAAAARSAPARRSEATAELTLEEAFRGTTRRVEVNGKRLEVTIPPGVDTGNRIKLTGKGPGGGDLVVVVKVQPHPVFIRRGADLERELPLTLREALVGGEVPVQTLKGRVLLTIPAGTQPGKSFRLTGQGMPRFKASGTGDLLVRTKVILPTNLPAEARAAAEWFLELVDQPDPRTS
jgi:curved DNA-binding protein